jgi:acyl-CoA reductase-like NAD-dependent aldehyde dehydrogenase
MPVPIFDQVLIGGEWVRAANGTYPVIDPATEEPAGHAPACSVEQVRAAARAARAAFEDGPWRTMTGAERGALLREAAERFRREMGGLVDLTIAETGAVRGVAETQQWAPFRCASRSGPSLPRRPPRRSYRPRRCAGVVVREPVGVVACITPFNFPMTNCAGKIGPALACGNTVVVKPAPVDPLGVAALCRIVASVLPPGVLNFVAGRARRSAKRSCAPRGRHGHVHGGSAVGQRIQEAAGPRMTRLLLELGGKSPNIVFADADPAKAIAMQV